MSSRLYRIFVCFFPARFGRFAGLQFPLFGGKFLCTGFAAFESTQSSECLSSLVDFFVHRIDRSSTAQACQAVITHVWCDFLLDMLDRSSIKYRHNAEEIRYEPERAER